MANTAVGIDIGGSGIKAALVDLQAGHFVGERCKVPTPRPATPTAVAEVCRRILAQLGAGDDVPVGIAIPAPLPHNRIPFMANLDKSWEGLQADAFFADKLGRPVRVLNDADAAGIAEVTFGAAKGIRGSVVITILGTGIGTALVMDGTLFPNTELGHLEIDGFDAESQASAGQRTAQGLDWDQWAARLQRYYQEIEKLFSPDVIVVGGGVSANHEKFLPKLNLRATLVSAALRNTAGIVGAAYVTSR